MGKGSLRKKIYGETWGKFQTNKHANLVQAITFQDNNLLTVEWTNHWHLVISYF